MVVDFWCVDSGSGGEAREGATAAAGWSCSGTLGVGVGCSRRVDGGWSGGGSVEVSVCVLFPLPRSASRALVHTGRRVVARVPPRCGHRSGEPGLVLGCSLWKAGRRSVESNGVQGQGQARGLVNDAGLQDLVSHKQAVKLGSIIVAYFVMYWIQEYRRRVEAKGSKRRFSETSAARKQGGKGERLPRVEGSNNLRGSSVNGNVMVTLGLGVWAFEVPPYRKRR